MFKSRLLRVSAAGAAAVAGVILVFVSVGAHGNSVPTRLASNSVINGVVKLATMAGVAADEDAAGIEDEARAEAAELAKEQQEEAAEAAAEAQEEANEDQDEAGEQEDKNGEDDSD
jgi:uncharacterized membrane protein